MVRSSRLLALVAVLALVAPVGGCAPANVPPEIVSLSCRQEILAPLDSCLIECVAEDDDGDAVEYVWSADSGTINGYEGTVAWTAPQTEGIYHITCEVSDGVEGQEAARETVTVIVKDNHYPAIDGMGAEYDWVRPGESCAVAVEASDIDGDALTYEWSAECGEVVGDGSEAVWTAPDVESDCLIRVVVSDGYGGERTVSVSVRTAAEQPLVVTDMVVTPVDEPEYLKFYDERFKILKGKTCTIRAVVNEADRIVKYEWSDGGPVTVYPVGGERFTFEAADVIRWTAPLERDEHSIKVVVWDAEGHSAEKTIVVKVETCTCAFSSSPSEDEESEEELEE